MDQECIPSFASPEQYLDICASFGWGLFTKGGRLFSYINYDLHNDFHSVDLDTESAGEADAVSIEYEVLEDSNGILDVNDGI